MKKIKRSKYDAPRPMTGRCELNVREVWGLNQAKRDIVASFKNCILEAERKSAATASR